MTTPFEIGKTYKGRNYFLVVSKTKKTLTIDSNVFGVKKLKISDFGDGYESVFFRSECITSDDYARN